MPSWNSYPDFPSAPNLTLADINGDGLSDIVATNTWFSLPGEEQESDITWHTEWYSANALGKDQLFPAVSWMTEHVQEAPPNAAYGSERGTVLDYNQDGRSDFLLHDLNGIHATWHVLRSAGSGGYVDEDTGIAVPFPTVTPRQPGLRATSGSTMDAMHFLDWNGDGVLDIVTCDYLTANQSTWKVNLWRPNLAGAAGPGFDPTPVPLTFGQIPNYPCWADVLVVDLDGDGATEMLIQDAVGIDSSTGQVVLGDTYTALASGDGRNDPWAVIPTWTPTSLSRYAGTRTLFQDLNGDGLPDAVHLRPDGSLTVDINTGDPATGYFVTAVVNPTPGWLLPNPIGKFGRLAFPMDYDHDGRGDIVLPVQEAGEWPHWAALRSRGDGSFDVLDVDLPLDNVGTEDGLAPSAESGLAPRITDVDGDGAEDVLFLRAQPNDNEVIVYRNLLGDADLLVSVSDGLSPLEPQEPGHVPTAAIRYGHLVDGAVTWGAQPGTPAWEAMPYIAHTGSALVATNTDNACSHERTCAVGSRRVVVGLDRNDGRNGLRHTDFAWRDGRYHRFGRGFLGFAGRYARDRETGGGVLSLYDNVSYDEALRVYPYAGIPYAEWRWNPATAEQPLQDLVELTFQHTVRAKRKTYDEKTYFLQPTIEWFRRVQGHFTPGQSPEPTLEAFVREVELGGPEPMQESFRQVEDYDDFGNVLAESIFSSQLVDTLSTTRQFQNDTATWLLGRLERQETTSFSMNGTETRVVGRTYDGAGLLASETTSDLAESDDAWQRTSLVRDVFGNVVEATVADKTGEHRTACWSFELDGIRPFAQGNAVGHIGFSRVEPGTGALLATVDPNGLLTQWTLDGLGRTVEELAPDGVTTRTTLTRTKDGGPAADFWTVRATTQVAGRSKDTTELDGRGRAVRWFSQNYQDWKQVGGFPIPTDRRIVRHVEMDALGDRIARRSLPYEEGTPAADIRYDSYTYDGAGRVVAHTTPWSATTTHQYYGRVTITTDAVGTQTVTESDGSGRPETIVAAGGTTSYGYGAFGLLHDVTLPDGTSYVLERDALGRVRKEIHPDRGLTERALDAFGQLTYSKDALGHETRWYYDPLGRAYLRTDIDGATRWTWDKAASGLGRLAELEGPTGLKEHYGYDALGRLSTTTLDVGSESFTTGRTYDAWSRLDTLSYPHQGLVPQLRVGHLYDAYGHLTSVYDVDQGTTYWHASDADGAGRLVHEVFGNGAATTRTYDEAKSRVDGIVTSLGGEAVQSLGYAYDPKLNLHARTDYVQGKTEEFEHDALDRLTCSRFPWAKGDECVEQWIYDDGGNITWTSELGTFTYDPEHPHAVQTAGSLSFGYDAVGNQVTRPDGTTIAYSARNQPLRYEDGAGAAIATFDYDGAGRRVRKTTPTEQTLFVGGLYERTTHGSETKHQHVVYGAERPVAVVATDGHGQRDVTYLHVDHLGSLDVVTGSAGVVEQRSYSAFGDKRDPSWGQPWSGGAPSAVPLGYTGHHEDAELGLVVAGERLYDPKLGRFLSTDPVVSVPHFGQSYNPYSYVMNGPLVYTDPTGREGEEAGRMHIDPPLLVTVAPWNIDLVRGASAPPPPRPTAVSAQVQSSQSPARALAGPVDSELSVGMPSDTSTAGDAVLSLDPLTGLGHGAASLLETVVSNQIDFTLGVVDGGREVVLDLAAQVLDTANPLSGFGGITVAEGLYQGYQEAGGGVLGAAVVVQMGIEATNPATPALALASLGVEATMAVAAGDHRAAGAAAGKAGMIFALAAEGGKGRVAEETTRVRHYTNRKGANGIEQEGIIRARDNNRVYVELANKNPLGQIDAETTYQLNPVVDETMLKQTFQIRGSSGSITHGTEPRS